MSSPFPVLTADSFLKVYFEFKRKEREQSLPEKTVQKMNIPKNQKQFGEYVLDRAYKKMRDMCSKGFDPNYNLDNGGRFPLFCVATSCCVFDLPLPSSPHRNPLDHRRLLR